MKTAITIIAILLATAAYAIECGPLTYVYGPDGKLYTCQTCGTITTCY